MNELEQIEWYLKNKLEGEALQKFETRLKNEADFRKKVDEYSMIFEGFEYLKMEALREKFKARSKDLPNIQIAKTADLPKRSSFSILKKLTAAIFILAAGALVWQYSGGGVRIPSDFAAIYYQDLSDGSDKSIADSPTQENSEIIYYKAKAEFYRNEFKTCVTTLDPIQRTDSLYLFALYLKQHAYYKSEQFEASLDAYKRIDQLKEEPLYRKKYLDFINAEWTSILAYLNIYQKEKKKANKEELLSSVKAFLQKSPIRKYREPAEQLQKWLE